MKQLGHSLMGLYLSEIVVSTAFERAYISGRIYTILCTSYKFSKSYKFCNGIQKNHCWTLSGQRLVFSQIWFSETMSVRFFNCCDFISSVHVNAYWVWLRHFWFCFFHSTLSNLVHPLLNIQQFCRFLFLLLDLCNLQIEPP